MATETSESAGREDDSHAVYTLRIFLLGAFRIERNHEAAPASAWQRRRTGKALVKLLAVTPGHRLHREQVLETLWPDANPDAADGGLRKALHYARHALEPELSRGSASRFLRLSDGMVSLSTDSAWIDADAFENLAARALRTGDRAVCEAALDSYSGELLPEERYADWTTGRRESIDALRERLLLRLADLLQAEGEYEGAMIRVRQLLTVDPLREDLHRSLMRLHAGSGSTHLARRQYHACRDILRQELDVDPEPETQELYNELVVSAKSPPDRSLAARAASPLPPPLRRPAPLPLIGRERALELLTDSVRRMVGREGELVLLGGEAGVGKTRLMSETALEAHRDGVLVLWGGSYKVEGAMPYGPFVEALEGYLSGVPAEERVKISGRYPELARLLPSLQGPDQAPASKTNPGADRMRLFTAVVHLLSDIGNAQPLVLALDDVHVADTASLELLHHLARQAPQERWLLLATYRDEDVIPGTQLYRLRAALTRSGACRRIDLHRLARSDADRLVALLLSTGALEPSLLDELYDLTRGNPFFLQQMVQSKQQHGQLELVGGIWHDRRDKMVIPSGVSELVEERVHELGHAVRRTLELAAVAGMEISFDVFEGSTELDSGSLLDALDRALNAHILEECGQGYAFVHPLMRSALHDRLSRVRRSRLHGAIARAIEQQRPEAVEELAYHYGRSADLDKAVTYLERAGDRAAALYANDAAVDYYRTARDRRQHAKDGTNLSRLNEKLGDVYLLLGTFGDAQQEFVRALQGETESGRRVTLRRKEGDTWGKRGEYDRALDAYHAAEAEVQALPVDVLPIEAMTALELSRGDALYRQSRHAEAVASAHRVIALLGDRHDPLVLARAHHLLGMIASEQGDDARAVSIFQEGLAVAEEAGDDKGISACLIALATSTTNSGDSIQGEVFQRRAMDLAERMGDRYGVAMGWNNLGVAAHSRGEYLTARESYRRSIDIREVIEDQEGLAVCWVNLGEAALFQGDLEEAEDACRRSLALFERTGDSYGIAYVWATAAGIAFAREDLGRAEDLFRRSLEVREQIGDRPGMVDCWIGLGELACDRGDAKTATQLHRRASRLARHKAPELEARAALGLARARLTAGCPRHTGALTRCAAQLAHKHSLNRIVVRATLLSAEIMLAQGASTPARLEAENALALAQACGLRLDEAKAHQLLDECRAAM